MKVNLVFEMREKKVIVHLLEKSICMGSRVDYCMMMRRRHVKYTNWKFCSSYVSVYYKALSCRLFGVETIAANHAYIINIHTKAVCCTIQVHTGCDVGYKILTFE